MLQSVGKPVHPGPPSRCIPGDSGEPGEDDKPGDDGVNDEPG